MFFFHCSSGTDEQISSILNEIFYINAHPHADEAASVHVFALFTREKFNVIVYLKFDVGQ